ncbi:hypothetical protein RCL1_008234 [Eukaryota sp. TZLM3-RCL]
MAFAIVDVENESNWEYFLEKLKNGLDEDDIKESMIVSDRHLGLLNGVKKVFGEDFPHAYCSRHLCGNFEKRYKEKGLEGFIWEALEAVSEEELIQAMGKIRNANAVQELIEIKQYWTTLFFNTQRYGHMTSNISESFSAVLKEARGLPIVQSLEAIRDVVSSWMVKRQQEAIEFRHQGKVVVPTVMSKIDKSIDIATRYETKLRGNGIVEVIRNRNETTRVFINERKCDCGRWQQLGFPCSHAAAALMKSKLRPEDFCREYFLVESFNKMYDQTIVPPRAKAQWTDVNRPLSPPAVKRRAGRPAVKRKKGFMERL